MKLGKVKRALFKVKRVLKTRRSVFDFDARREVREVARLGQRLVVMELR